MFKDYEHYRGKLVRKLSPEKIAQNRKFLPSEEALKLINSVELDSDEAYEQDRDDSLSFSQTETMDYVEVL